MSTFYALRYVAGTLLVDRKHAPTLGRWSTYEDADEEREKRRQAKLLEVVVRGDVS